MLRQREEQLLFASMFNCPANNSLKYLCYMFTTFEYCSKQMVWLGNSKFRIGGPSMVIHRPSLRTPASPSPLSRTICFGYPAQSRQSSTVRWRQLIFNAGINTLRTNKQLRSKLFIEFLSQECLGVYFEPEPRLGQNLHQSGALGGIQHWGQYRNNGREKPCVRN